MHYNEIKPLIDSIENFGYMGSERQREYMFNLGKVTTCAAEIGTYKGLSAAIVGLGMKSALSEKTYYRTYYCIDTFESSNVELDGNNTLNEFKQNMKSCQLSICSEQDLHVKYATIEEPGSPLLIYNKGFSYNEVAKIPNNLDWIYIDGSHETRDVLQDIELYHSKVKDGGLILFHDHTWPSVRVAVDMAEAKGLIQLVNIIDDFGIYKKLNK